MPWTPCEGGRRIVGLSLLVLLPPLQAAPCSMRAPRGKGRVGLLKQEEEALAVATPPPDPIEAPIEPPNKKKWTGVAELLDHGYLCLL